MQLAAAQQSRSIKTSESACSRDVCKPYQGSVAESSAPVLKMLMSLNQYEYSLDIGEPDMDLQL